MLDTPKNIERTGARAGEVEQNQGRIANPKRTQSFFSTARTADLETTPNHLGGQKSAHRDVVIDDQNPQFFESEPYHPRRSRP